MYAIMAYVCVAVMPNFYEIDNRRCAIAVNGAVAFWCNTVAVNTLLSAAG